VKNHFSKRIIQGIGLSSDGHCRVTMNAGKLFGSGGLLSKTTSDLSGKLDRFHGIALGLGVLLLGLVVVLLMGSGKASGAEVDVSYEQGNSTTNVCLNDITHYFNITVTNNDNESVTARVTHTLSDQFQSSVSIASNDTHVFRFTKFFPKDSAWQKTSVSVILLVTYQGSNNTTYFSNHDTAYMFDLGRCSAMKLETSRTHIKARDGDRISFKIQVHNDGNFYDDFRVVVDGIPSGWHSPQYENITLDEVATNEWRDKMISLYPRDSGDFVLNITAYSLYDEDIRLNVQVTLEIEESPTGQYISICVILLAAIFVLVINVMAWRKDKQDFSEYLAPDLPLDERTDKESKDDGFAREYKTGDDDEGHEGSEDKGSEDDGKEGEIVDLGDKGSQGPQRYQAADEKMVHLPVPARLILKKDDE